MTRVKIIRPVRGAAKVLVLLSVLFAGSIHGPGRASRPPEESFGALLQDREATLQNLLTAYRGEVTASTRYAAWAWKAKEEGYPRIALLFSAVSNSEHMHAKNHKAAILTSGGAVPEIKPTFRVRTTRENLEEAIGGESGEISTMYPGFMDVANREGNKQALESFNRAYKAEIKHKAFFEDALSALMSNDLTLLPLIYSVCQVCGNIYSSEPPKRCAICSSPADRFLQVTSW